MITARNMILEEVSFISGAYHITDDGVAEFKGGIVIKNGEQNKLTPLLAVTGTPRAAIYQTESMNAHGIFRVYGTVRPVGATVHILNEDDFSTNDLMHGVIASVQSDSNGEWSIDNITGWEGNCVAWAYIGSDYTAAMTSSLVIHKEITEILDTGGSGNEGDTGDAGDSGDSGDTTPEVSNRSIQYVIDHTLADISEDGWPAITISGDCTTGADTVYVSVFYESDWAKCGTCGGVGYVPHTRACPACDGSGEIPAGICQVCGGHGEFVEAVSDIPPEYDTYVDYATSNFYRDSYANLLLWDYGDWLAVSFLMNDFTIQSYDSSTSEITATGWYTCGYTYSTEEWTCHDYRDTVSPGGNYTNHIVYGSCIVTYNGIVLYSNENGMASDGSCPYCFGEHSEGCALGCFEGNLIGQPCPVCIDGTVASTISCPVCDGSGTYALTVDCGYCDGSGYDSLAGESCNHCAGTGYSHECDVCNDCHGDGYTQSSDLLASLLSGQVAAESVSGTSFSIYFDGSYGESYVIWAYGDTGSITAFLEYTPESCLAGETMITMADCGRKRMDEISIGDSVLAGNGRSTVVTDILRGYECNHHTLYEFSDGSVVDEVGRHRFYNVEQGFWQYLNRWNIGEHAVREDGTHVALVGRRRLDEPKEMFGLWTESTDYYAEGLLTGETAANQQVLPDIDIDTAANILSTLDVRTLTELTGLERALP